MSLRPSTIRESLKASEQNAFRNWPRGGAAGPVGPWEYATLAAAESSGDPWVNGDQVTITGGAVFTYLLALAVSGYSGLIHKYPYDGIGTAGTLNASTVAESQDENVDPDTWGWADNSIGTKGVDYDFDTNSGYARFRDLTNFVGYASLRSPNIGSSEAELFIIMDLVNLITTITVNKARLWNSNYIDASNAKYTRLSAGSTNWELLHNSGTADTGKAYTGTYRIFWYLKQGQWAVWFDGEGTAPTVSGTVPLSIALPRPHLDSIIGDSNNSGTSDFILGRHVIGGMTTA